MRFIKDWTAEMSLKIQSCFYDAEVCDKMIFTILKNSTTLRA